MEYLFSVFWKEIRIGLLFKYNNNFLFTYDQNGINKTREMGFDKLIGFPDINRIYINKELFPIFDSRIISSKRTKFNNKQEKIQFLIETKGRLVTDNISIDYEEKENVKRRV